MSIGKKQLALIETYITYKYVTKKIINLPSCKNFNTSNNTTIWERKSCIPLDQHEYLYIENPLNAKRWEITTIVALKYLAQTFGSVIAPYRLLTHVYDIYFFVSTIIIIFK